ncbi:MAG: dipeptide epimerase [Pseudopedobacter saltans]|uniref:Dipeptide epimerase n=1 Tax=Pseudopedobacter saltans TaxID=151895 RepID=A0A2W5FEL6_9SPHI|nr:MAG: dipeptide epimerase [Pseudopedobacter saltans]
MTIQSIEVFKFPIPIEPFTIATGTLTTAQNLLVRIHTDEGITGYGECSAFPMIVGETQATCFELAKDFATIWKGKSPLEIDVRMSELHLYCYGNYTVKSAFDMALYDIAAKNANLPLYKFLGGVKRKIITDVTIGIDTPDVMASKALSFKNKGFETIKIKLGKNIDDDIARIKAIRIAIGKETKLRIDANQGWDQHTALQALQLLVPYNIEFCEQPMRKWMDTHLPYIVTKSPIPIMADESVFTHHDAETIIATKSTNFINIKFAKSGGILEAIKINKVAEENNIRCMLGSMMESRLALAANLHFALATKNIQFFDLDTALLGQQEDPVIDGMVYNGHEITVPDLPGIGATVEEEYLRKQESFIL